LACDTPPEPGIIAAQEIGHTGPAGCAALQKWVDMQRAVIGKSAFLTDRRAALDPGAGWSSSMPGRTATGQVKVKEWMVCGEQ
jgi:hypothetical protein